MDSTKNCLPEECPRCGAAIIFKRKKDDPTRIEACCSCVDGAPVLDLKDRRIKTSGKGNRQTTLRAVPGFRKDEEDLQK